MLDGLLGVRQSGPGSFFIDFRAVSDYAKDLDLNLTFFSGAMAPQQPECSRNKAARSSVAT